MKESILIVTQPEVTSKVGGAITMFCFLSNLLSKAGYDVHGVCNSETDGRPKNLDPSVTMHNLYLIDHKTEGFSSKIQDLIRQTKPACIIFFFHYLYIDAALGREFDSIPRILTFHSRPDFYFTLHKSASKKLRPLYKNTTAQILFNSFTGLLPRFIRRGKVITIPNPVQRLNIHRNIDSEAKRIVFLSRIDNCKGVDMLIKAFAPVAAVHNDWSLDIWGEFESEYLRESYCAMIHSLGLENNIFFRGVTTHPVKTLCDYDFCVFPSLFEGFSIGLAESLSAGLPCIGFRHCSGVNEMIDDGINGFLCEDIDEMSARMERLISDSSLRKELSLEALKINGRYDESHIKWLWENAVADAIHPKVNNKLCPAKFLVRKITGR